MWKLWIFQITGKCQNFYFNSNFESVNGISLVVKTTDNLENYIEVIFYIKFVHTFLHQLSVIFDERIDWNNEITIKRSHMLKPACWILSENCHGGKRGWLQQPTPRLGQVYVLHTIFLHFWKLDENIYYNFSFSYCFD